MTDRVETAILIPFGEARFIADHRGEMSEFLAAIEANDAELVVLRAQRDAALALCDELERVAASGKPYEPIRTNALRAALGVQPEPAETPTFEQLLRDPTEQFDKDSELLPGLLRSIDEYRDAPSGTASAFAHKHAWGEWQPMPQVPRDRIRRESRRCKTWACDATQIRAAGVQPEGSSND